MANTIKLRNGYTIANEARIAYITFDEDMIHCALMDRRIISVPLTWYPRLYKATVEQRNKWEIIMGGEGVHWEEIDEDLHTKGFLSYGRA